MAKLPGTYPILERPHLAQVNPRTAGPKLHSQRLKTQTVPPRVGENFWFYLSTGIRGTDISWQKTVQFCGHSSCADVFPHLRRQSHYLSH